MILPQTPLQVMFACVEVVFKSNAHFDRDCNTPSRKFLLISVLMTHVNTGYCHCGRKRGGGEREEGRGERRGEGKSEHTHTHTCTDISIFYKGPKSREHPCFRNGILISQALTSFATTEVFEPSPIVHPFGESFPVASADPQSLAHPQHLSPLLL